MRWFPVLGPLTAALLTASAAHAASDQGHSGHEHHPSMGESDQTPAMPTEPGQSAFAAIQEIVRLLNENPDTDWKRVDIEALRQHLMDMNALTLKAKVTSKPIPGGFEARVTGEGRTRAAIRRMVPAHRPFVDGYRGWSVTAQPVENGYRVRATAEEAAETARLRGLGFMGLMVSRAHHQRHHWMIATGRDPHR